MELGETLEAAVNGLAATLGRIRGLSGEEAELNCGEAAARQAVHGRHVKHEGREVELSEAGFAAVRFALAVLLRGLARLGWRWRRAKCAYRTATGRPQDVDGVLRSPDGRTFLLDYRRMHSLVRAPDVDGEKRYVLELAWKRCRCSARRTDIVHAKSDTPAIFHEAEGFVVAYIAGGCLALHVLPCDLAKLRSRTLDLD